MPERALGLLPLRRLRRHLLLAGEDQEPNVDWSQVVTHYRAAAAATLRIVPLDALTLIYHRASGITHIVDSPVPELLEVLGEKALTLDETLAGLAAAHDLIDPDRDALAARLDELVAAGLVEAA